MVARYLVHQMNTPFIATPVSRGIYNDILNRKYSIKGLEFLKEFAFPHFRIYRNGVGRMGE